MFCGEVIHWTSLRISPDLDLDPKLVKIKTKNNSSDNRAYFAQRVLFLGSPLVWGTT